MRKPFALMSEDTHKKDYCVCPQIYRAEW